MTTSGYLGLQSQDVAVLHVRRGQRVCIEQLSPRTLMMEFVAHHLTVRTMPWQIEAVDKYSDQAVYFCVSGDFNYLPLVAGRVPDLDLYIVHGVNG